MNTLPGFPHQVGGITRYSKRVGNPSRQDLSHLGQEVEACVLQMIPPSTRQEMDALAEAIREAASSERLAPYIETVHRAVVVGDVLEVEFSAAGYPGRYIKYIGLDRKAGKYRLRRAPDPDGEEIIVSHTWVHDEGSSVCVGEARDRDGTPLARVHVAVELNVEEDLRRYHGERGIREVELAARRLARELAEGPPLLPTAKT